jgi:hypothetical protein
MVTPPPIDIPTAIVAAVLTLLGNQGMNIYLRMRDEKLNNIDNKIEWYESLIEICHRINNSYMILKVAYSDDLVALANVEEFFADTYNEDFDAVIGRQDFLYETACEQIKAEYSNLFNHISKSPRGFEVSDIEEITSVLISCIMILSDYETKESNFTSTIPRQELPKEVASVVDKCETKIDELEKEKKSHHLVRKKASKLRS